MLDWHRLLGSPKISMSSTTEMVAPGFAETSPSVEERRALVERVAGSSHFSRSVRLRDFLLYVGEQSLKPDRMEIHEQEIGAKVFGRPPTYDRSQDNIVRVNATELRKRIELYFATEGVHEPLVLEIPRGGYKPVFHRRLHPTEETATQTRPTTLSSDNTTAEAAHPRRLRERVWWATATLLLATACIYLLLENRTIRESAVPIESKPALAAFWNAFAPGHQQTDVVLADDSVSVIEDITHQPISLQDYLSREYMRQIQSRDLSPDRKTDLDEIDSHNLITFGSVRAAQLVMAEMSAASTPHLTLSRYYTADAMKRNDVILIGGRKANPWVHLFDDQMNFIVGFDHVQGHAFISNQHPKPGEQALYTAPLYPNALTGYSVVAYLPNPSHDGNVIILAGMDSDSTSAAAEFLTSESQMESFRRTLHVKEFPYFEVLLRISRVSGTSFNAELVAYRTYPKVD